MENPPGRPVIPVSRKENTPPENETLGKMSLQSTESGAGEQLLPLDSMARARIEGVFISQTPVGLIPKRPIKFQPQTSWLSESDALSVGLWMPCHFHIGLQFEKVLDVKKWNPMELTPCLNACRFAWGSILKRVPDVHEWNPAWRKLWFSLGQNEGCRRKGSQHLFVYVGR